jgi:hypothetical protein
LLLVQPSLSLARSLRQITHHITIGNTKRVAGNERYDVELIRRLGLLFSAQRHGLCMLVTLQGLRLGSMMSAELGAVEKCWGSGVRGHSRAEIGRALSDGI